MIPTQTTNLLRIFLTIYLLPCKTTTSEVSRPRGVSLSRAPLYVPDNEFTCLDGSKTIPFLQVNDDYCDCPDASDEPGTAACPNGHFHCTNAGHKPANIPSSRVNDGICDCCDGTDEYASGVTCSNNCVELGRTAREAAQRRAELVKAGKQQRQELVQKGLQLRQEKEAKLKELQKNREEADRLRKEKEAIKKDAEGLENVALDYYRKLEEEEKKKKAEEEELKNKAEAVETFNKFDSNQDGVIEIAELQTRQTFDRDRNGEVTEEEAKYFLDEQEAVDQDTFIEKCWTNIKPYLMMEAQVFKPPETTSEAEDMQEEDEEDPEAQDDDEAQDDTYGEEEESEPIVEQDSSPSKIEYDEETQKVIERATAARNEYQDADSQVKNIDSEIKNIQEYLEKDFGTEEEFATLQGQCFEYEDNEYIYKLCPFDKTSQQPKSGSSETRLGSWGKWSGPDADKYEQMYYDRGQSCWNGPQRSTTVKVTCGGENKVTSVTEPSRCEYLFEFITPAACREATPEPHEDWHDEL